MSTQTVNQLVDKLVTSAHKFKTDDDGGIIAIGRSGLLAISLVPMATGEITVPALIAGLFAKAGAPALGTGLAYGLAIILPFAAIFLGLAQIGEAKRAGDRIAALTIVFHAYVTTYVKTLAYFATASQPSRPKPVTNVQAFQEWENFAINTAIAVLKAMGETDGRAVLNHLKATYHTESNIVNALLPKVRQHCAQNVPPKVRRYLFR